MEFRDVTVAQAIAIISHFRAIAQIAGMMDVTFFVTSNDAFASPQMEPVFLKGYKRVFNVPTRKYFRVKIDGEMIDISFSSSLDLKISLLDV